MKGKKIISVMLAGLMLFSAVGCNDSNTNKDETNTTKPVGTVQDRDNVYVEGMLHKVNVTPSNKVFAENKKSEYKFVLGNESNAIITASNFIFTHVREATGVSLDYAEAGVTWSASAKYIVLGDSEMYKAAGLTVPTDDLGPVGYYIKTAGNSVFIMAKNKEGYQLASIAFLRALLGYDMIAGDTVIYEKDGKTLPNMDIVERPDYDVRVVTNGGISQNTAYGMGYSADRGMISVGGAFVHNSFNYLPPATYLESNPEWYSDVLLSANNQDYRQICYTAHGNEESYDLMQDTIIDVMMDAIIADPDKTVVSFTQQDVNAYCKCESCLEAMKPYGAYSALMIMFCNDLADKLDVALTQYAETTGEEKRDIQICFFAYHFSEAPPVTKNAKGEYEPINGLRCNENVAVFIASIETKYYYSFYDEVNEVYAENMYGWMAITDTILLWLYQTNFGEYLYPYNTWNTQIENYRFGKTVGARYMFSQGQANHPNSTGFTKLKEYIDSKALLDVNVQYDELVDRYFKYYFMDAEKPMRQFFDELQAYMTYLETEYSTELTGYIRDSIAQSKYWSPRTIQHWLELIDEAYAAIEKYKSTDVNLYNRLHEHIMLEAMFPRYVMCTLHTGFMSAEALKQMRQDFYMDATTLRITNVREVDTLSGIYQTWGVI